MRRTLAALFSVVVAVGLAACGGGTDASLDTGTVGFTVPEGVGETPTFTFADSPPEGLQVEATTTGDGAEVTEGQYVVAHYEGRVWGSEEAFDSSFGSGAPVGFPLTGVIQGWADGLVGQTIGSRVLLSIPSELGYAEGNESAGIAVGDTIVFVVDLVAAYDLDVAGEADATESGEALPVEIGGDLGSPVASITVPSDAVEPTEVSTVVVASGSGEEAGADSVAIIHYYLATVDGSLTESSWELGYGPQQIQLGGGTFFDELTGVPVGSRVLFALPAGVAAEQAMYVVVDVIDAL